MNRIEENLLFYGDLSPEERAEVDAYISEHPELKSVLQETRRLGVLFDEVRSVMEEAPENDVLAYYVVTRCYSRFDVPAGLRSVFERVDERIASDPSARARYQEFVERLRRLEAQSDSAEQFQRLTGYALESETAEPALEKGSPTSEETPRTRLMLLVDQLPALVRWAASVTALLLIIYGGLSAVSVATTPQHERLAAIDHDELRLEGFDVRPRGDAAAPNQDSPDLLYVETLTALREARGSIFGLFPQYDHEALITAQEQLEQVVQETEPGSFVQLDAYYFLGKVRLAQGSITEAQEAFQQVVHGEGRMSSEAYDILHRLAAEDAYE